MEETSAASDAANAPNPYGSGAPEEEKRRWFLVITSFLQFFAQRYLLMIFCVYHSLTGTALARTKITTEREKRLVKSDLFEPLLANLLAFVKVKPDSVVMRPMRRRVVLYLKFSIRKNPHCGLLIPRRWIPRPSSASIKLSTCHRRNLVGSQSKFHKRYLYLD